MESPSFLDKIGEFLLPVSSAVAAMLLLLFLVSACATTTVNANHGELVRLVKEALNKKQREVKQVSYLAPVHFPTNGTNPVKNDLPILSANVEWLKAHPETIVMIEGHCDERGDDLYNVQLGDRRARNIKSNMVQGGVDENRFSIVISMGEKEPKDASHTAAAWSTNRRVELVVH